MGIQIIEMTEEDIDNLMSEHIHVMQTMGYLTMEAFEQSKYHAAEGMIRFGGNFMKNLGYALAHADVYNAAKIKSCWRSEWAEHAMLHRAFMAKRHAGVKDE